MRHKKVKMKAFADFNPILHEAVCECGYSSGKSADFLDVLKMLEEHRKSAALKAASKESGE